MPRQFAPQNNEQARTKRHFDRHSDFWLEVYQRPEIFAGYCLIRQHEYVTERINQTKGIKRILDVGCGSGFTVIELAKAGYYVNGIDIAPRMIRLAKRQAAKSALSCDFQIAGVERLPYRDQAFDAVIALGLLGNLRNDRQALEEIRRVLRPGGCLILSMPNQLALDRLISFPRSLPIMLGTTPARGYLRSLANRIRRWRGHNIKPRAQLRFGRSVAPCAYQKHLRESGFYNARFVALAYGPMIPFGLAELADKQQIRISKKLEEWSEKWHGLSHMGTIIVYDSQRI